MRLNWIVSEYGSLIFGMVRSDLCEERSFILAQSCFQDHHIAFGTVSYMPATIHEGAGDVSLFGGNVNKDDRHRRVCSPRCQSVKTVDCNKNVDLERDKLGSKAVEAFRDFGRKAVFQDNVLTFDVAEIER